MYMWYRSILTISNRNLERYLVKWQKVPMKVLFLLPVLICTRVVLFGTCVVWYCLTLCRVAIVMCCIFLCYTRVLLSCCTRIFPRCTRILSCFIALYPCCAGCLLLLLCCVMCRVVTRVVFLTKSYEKLNVCKLVILTGRNFNWVQELV